MKKTIFIASLGLIVLAGCSNGSDNSTINNVDHSHHTAHSTDSMVIGDIREKTSSIEVLPNFLTGKHEGLQQTYALVAQHQDLLEKIPCYCGCGDSVGHKSSYDCFIYENESDGSVMWDDHGTKCNVCVEIAVKSIVDYSNGTSVEEIRDKIDEQYKEGYAKPTPTPKL